MPPRSSWAARRSTAAASTSRATPTSIRRGTIDFANPQKIDPLFDIEAETRIRSYRVTLKVNGTLERVYPTLSSDPPLCTVEILSLLAGADESAVEVAQAGPGRVDRMAATGRGHARRRPLSEEVGLERGAAPPRA